MEAWKGHFLSMSGYLALIKSSIYGSLLHSFMIYKWPSTLLKYIEKAIHNFLWTSSISSRKLVTVVWDKYCYPINEGGISLKKTFLP